MLLSSDLWGWLGVAAISGGLLVGLVTYGVTARRLKMRFQSERG
jgi:hypothetical protein